MWGCSCKHILADLVNEPGTQKQFGATVTIDALGMRATETTPDSDKWLILGDSSFFGHGLDDDGTLHHHLESALRAEGANIDVICATPWLFDCTKFGFHE